MHETVCSREPADVAHQRVFVFLAPGFSYSAHGKEKTGNRVGGNTEPLVALFYENEIFRLPERYRVALAFPQAVGAQRCTDQLFHFKVPFLDAVFCHELAGRNGDRIDGQR